MKLVPKEVYPLVLMMVSALAGASAFTVHSLFKPDVFLDRKRRMSLFK